MCEKGKTYVRFKKHINLQLVYNYVKFHFPCLLQRREGECVKLRAELDEYNQLDGRVECGVSDRRWPPFLRRCNVSA